MLYSIGRAFPARANLDFLISWSKLTFNMPKLD
jgi:hypothetical protein